MSYTDDLGASDSLYLDFVRSTVAHGDIKGIDLTGAVAMPGVVAAIEGKEAESLIGPRFGWPPPALTGLDGPIQLTCLPVSTVTYWGEPVALIVAETAEQARRATEVVEVSYDPKSPLLTIEQATAPHAAALHPQFQNNVIMAESVAQGNPDSIIAASAMVVEGIVRMGRSSAVPLEPRSCIAHWDSSADRLTVHVTSQNPHFLRAELSRQLRVPESDIRVITPPLGGAFGFKLPCLPEEPLACLMSMRLGRPVRWTEHRREAMLVGAREYDMNYRASYDRTGRVTALRATIDGNLGALSSSPASLMPSVAANAIPGAYDISDFQVDWRAVTTNKGPWNAARGFGKEAACVLLESVIDEVARSLQIDPVEVRRRNLLTSDQLPHRTASMTLDSGDYPRALEMAVEAGEYNRWRQVQKDQSPNETFRIGIGIGFELTPEGTDVGGTLARGYETSTVRLDTSGCATVMTGVTSPGTGSETAIAQLVADQLGIPIGNIRVVQGDTDRTPFGGGSYSSRAVLTGGTAAWLAAGELRERINAVAAALLGVEPSHVIASDGIYSARGRTERIPFSDLVHNYYALGNALAGIGTAELEATCTYGPRNTQPIPDAAGRLQTYPTYAYSVHMAVVEVDVDTGITEIKSLTVVHDSGKIINHDLANCQLHGCVGMGVGMALLEEECYDNAGVPLSTDFKRYMMPRIREVPPMVLRSLESPSPFSLLGTKGAGESGVGGSAAAIVAAVRDAVGGAPGATVQLPVTPERVLDWLDASRAIRGTEV
ncbi:xanthine dehydrogenase family protein molybdopterin-binding subunit [Nocardia sp. NPDC004168]|uniref:xanthine dehydrogenase family protein molybdopterin-binding subunit n=1 Tax=Nocardia sp. NPDC004168 TaxID=3154452 RepID=UPI0033BCEBDA